MKQSASRLSSMFKLEYPQSVGVYNSYDEAQRVVDFLADARFPVENLCIVGTELRSVERVLGRRSWGTVIGQGVQSGVSTGVMIALLMWLFVPNDNPLLLAAYALAIGITVGVAMAVLAYWMSQGKRDFTSVSQTIATKYEVLAEHKVAGQARELVTSMPGARAAQFTPAGVPVQQGQPQPNYAPAPAPYGQNPGQYGQNPGQSGQNPPQHGQGPAQYGQAPAQYGQNPGPYGQNPAPYGQAQGQPGQGPAHYGQTAGQYGQAPYGQSAGPYSQAPYGQSAGPYSQQGYPQQQAFASGQPQYGPYGAGSEVTPTGLGYPDQEQSTGTPPVSSAPVPDPSADEPGPAESRQDGS